MIHENEAFFCQPEGVGWGGKVIDKSSTQLESGITLPRKECLLSGYFLDPACTSPVLYLLLSGNNSHLHSMYLHPYALLWRRKWQLTPVFLPGKSHRQMSLVGYSPWGPIELDMTKRLTHMLYYLSYLNPAPLDPIFSLWSQYHFSASHGESEVKVLVVSHSLLQGIFLTQGSNLGLRHCGQILYRPTIRATREAIEGFVVIVVWLCHAVCGILVPWWEIEPRPPGSGNTES